MTMMLTNDSTDLHQLQRLTLRIERNLLKQSYLETILKAARTAIAGHRQELRALQTRMTRTGAGKAKAQR